MDYGKHFSTLKTPQTEQARGDQVQNSAGGFTFTVSKWSQLDRWLILGSSGGTYYATEKKLTVENAKVVQECLKEDGLRTVGRIVHVSDKGLAPKNDPAIFALAIAAGAEDPHTRAAALAALPQVCRTGTHLFTFVQQVGNFRRWGRGLRRAVANWYLEKKPYALANQLVKYRQRDGWSHKDVFRLAHPQATTPEHATLFRYAVAGKDGLGDRAIKRNGKDGPDTNYAKVGELPAFVEAFEEAQTTKSQKRLCDLIREHGLTHEMLPTEWKQDPAVWEALLEKMPQTALIRNLGKMTEVGLLAPMSKEARLAAEKLTDKDALKRGRVHPMTVLIALRIYQQGHGDKGKLKWDPVRDVVDALDEAFYASFDAVEPTGKNTLLALDVSGSMDSPVAGLPLTCREASAAMAMVTARTEKNWHCMGFGHQFVDLDISPRQRLDDVVRKISGLPFSGTDCSLPMLYALTKKLEVDSFLILTDNETYAGSMHPHQALQKYRREFKRPARLCVCAMTATSFSIADPNDVGSLDVCGLDSSVPSIIANHFRG